MHPDDKPAAIPQRIKIFRHGGSQAIGSLPEQSRRSDTFYARARLRRARSGPEPIALFRRTRYNNAMFESMRSRLLLALGVALVVTLVIVVSLSLVNRRRDAKLGDLDPVAVWKSQTGVDLDALSREQHPDSDEARALDALLLSSDLQLGARSKNRKPPVDDPDNNEAHHDVVEYLRAAIRAGTTAPQPLPPRAIALIERHATALDAVAAYVAMHHAIRWHEDFGPRQRGSAIYVRDHLTLHRLLIGRAFLALARNDVELARRMLAASQQLSRPLGERRELDSQSIAVGVERLQLALLRRAGAVLRVLPPEPLTGLRERYLIGMSAEAARYLANARQSPLEREVDDLPDRVADVVFSPSIAAATHEQVAAVAGRVAEIQRAEDQCGELAKKWRGDGGFFDGHFYTLNPNEAWRRFVVLALDRAITTAVLTGRASSPCRSVTITVRDEGESRVVEARGLPADSENIVPLPAVVRAVLQK